MYVLDTQKIGRKIQTARKAHNMTQLALADQLGVSYQAISNWERGQSAPDIDKLPDLAQALDISLNELFDMPDAEKKVVTIRQDNAPVDAKTLTEFAPMIKPDTLNKKAAADAAEFSVADLLAIAPFLGDDALAELLNDHEHDANFSELLVSVAPFVSEEYLGEHVDALIQNDSEINNQTVTKLLPFLDEDKVDALLARLVARGDVNDDELTAYFPFASSEALGAIVAERDHDLTFIAQVAPFLDEERIDQIFLRKVASADVEISDLNMLAPFVSSDALKQAVRELLNDKQRDVHLQDLMPLMPFLDDTDLLSLLRKSAK